MCECHNNKLKKMSESAEIAAGAAAAEEGIARAAQNSNHEALAWVKEQYTSFFNDCCHAPMDTAIPSELLRIGTISLQTLWPKLSFVDGFKDIVIRLFRNLFSSRPHISSGQIVFSNFFSKFSVMHIILSDKSC